MIRLLYYCVYSPSSLRKAWKNLFVMKDGGNQIRWHPTIRKGIESNKWVHYYCFSELCYVTLTWSCFELNRFRRECLFSMSEDFVDNFVIFTVCDYEMKSVHYKKSLIFCLHILKTFWPETNTNLDLWMHSQVKFVNSIIQSRT